MKKVKKILFLFSNKFKFQNCFSLISVRLFYVQIHFVVEIEVMYLFIMYIVVAVYLPIYKYMYMYVYNHLHARGYVLYVLVWLVIYDLALFYLRCAVL